MTDGVLVARAAKAAGFPDSQLVTAVAIAYAESSFDENATNRSNRNGSTDYGLWQINSVHDYPELKDGSWKDPKVNAQLAYRVWKSQGWGAWSVYKPTDPVGFARYQAALPAAAVFVAAGVGAGAAASGAGGAVLNQTGSGTTAAGDIKNSAAALAVEPLAVLKWLQDPASWIRISKMAAGMGLLLGGAYLLTRAQIEPYGKKIAETALNVVPIGKVGKVAAVAKGAVG